MKYALTLILLLFICNGAKCANILGIFYSPSKSHHILGSTLLKALAKRGHNVTVLSSFPLSKPFPNYTDLVIKDVDRYKQEMMLKVTAEGSELEKMQSSFDYIVNVQDEILKQKTVQDLLTEDNRFDVIILDYPASEPFFGMSHRFKAPLVLFMPSRDVGVLHAVTGNAIPFSYIPCEMVPFSSEMNFMQRVINTLSYAALQYVYYGILFPRLTDVLEKHFPDAPPYEQLLDNVALVLLNSHYSTDFPKPFTPNIIQIGGFHLQDFEPLRADLQKYLDDATEGVVYFSFGSKIESFAFTEEKMNMFLSCFSKLKQKVLWKFNKEDLGVIPENVRVENWMPQKGILSHPNVKAFITHGGFGGIAEAIYGAVPMIAMPFYGDQCRNVKNAVTNEYAIEVDYHKLTEEILSKAIDEIINNPKYQENAQRVSSLYRDQPINPLQKAIFWVEHVIKHKGAKHLRPASTKLSTMQHYLVDVVAFLCAAVIIIMIFIYFVTKTCIKLLCRKKSSTKLKSS